MWLLRGPRGVLEKKFSRLAIARHIFRPLINYAVIRPLNMACEKVMFTICWRSWLTGYWRRRSAEDWLDWQASRRGWSKATWCRLQTAAGRGRSAVTGSGTAAVGETVTAVCDAEVSPSCRYSATVTDHRRPRRFGRWCRLMSEMYTTNLTIHNYTVPV